MAFRAFEDLGIPDEQYIPLFEKYGVSEDDIPVALWVDIAWYLQNKVDLEPLLKQCRRSRKVVQVKDILYIVDKDLHEERIVGEKSLLLSASDSSGIMCPKCKGTNVTFHTVQIRSADEGASAVFQCPDCGNSWTT